MNKLVFVSILKDTTDPYYRYKMPKLIIKSEGSGNGIRTIIVNMNAIARALRRPPSYSMKYFGCVLGSQTQFKHNYYIVNGSHDAEVLQAHLFKADEGN